MLVGQAALAALQLSNLLYVAAAVVVATLISALIALRHRRPKSLESGIESFSRELRALAPEPEGVDGRPPRPPPRSTGIAVRPRSPTATLGTGRRPRGEHYRRPVVSSSDGAGEHPSAGRPESQGQQAPGAAGDASTRTDGQTG